MISPFWLIKYINLSGCLFLLDHYSNYEIEVVDLLINPTLAKDDQILALPTLVRKLPEPIKKIIGDLSNIERVLVGLDIRPLEPKNRWESDHD